MIRDYVDEVCDLNRSLVTEGYDEALARLDSHLPGPLETTEIPSGTSVWTWTVPDKWDVHEAYISDGTERLVDYDHPLRVVTYSESIDREISKETLLDHLHTDEALELNGQQIPKNPEALPYKFKFYDRDWGFCLRESELEDLLESSTEHFEVCIDVTFEPGDLRVGEFTVHGQTDETVFLMGHLDHPAQANDGLSGVAVGAELMNRLQGRDTRFTYKLLVVPETIGSIAFFSQNEAVTDQMKYGIFLEMLGSDGSHALQYSHQGDTTIDKISKEVLERSQTEFSTGPFREVIGNDEMVTNGPGLNIPTISLSRWPYDEYHTSYDTPEIISESQLRSSANIVEEIIDVLEHNIRPLRQFKGPVFLSGYGLWNKWGGRGAIRQQFESLIMHLEGDCTVSEIAEEHDLPFWDVYDFLADLYVNDLVEARDGIFPNTEDAQTGEHS